MNKRQQASTSRQTYTYYSEIVEKKIQWLWYPYIPYGKLTVLQGDPGIGKSTMMLHISAALTAGKNMPDGYEVKNPETVLYQCSEDDLADTIKPRLTAAGADCARVAYIIDVDEALHLEDARIEETIRATGGRLFVLDPLQSFPSQSSDIYLIGKMRSALSKLATVAAKHKCAVVLITHMNKTDSGKSLYRALGSIDIAAIARSVLIVEASATKPGLRAMSHIKSSLAPTGADMFYYFNNEKGSLWISASQREKILTPPEIADGKKVHALEILLTMLADSDRPCTEVLEKAKAEGIANRTMYKAKKDAGIQSFKQKGVWRWRMPNSR